MTHYILKVHILTPIYILSNNRFINLLFNFFHNKFKIKRKQG